MINLIEKVYSLSRNNNIKGIALEIIFLLFDIDKKNSVLDVIYVSLTNKNLKVKFFFFFFERIIAVEFFFL